MTEAVAYKEITQEFYHYLDDIIKIYAQEVVALQEEFAAIRDDDVSLLNENMKKQQALLLKTKLFTQTIDQYNRKLNINASNLSQTISQLEPEDQPAFQDLLLQFEAITGELTFYRDQCKTLLQTKLYHIDKSLSGFEKSIDTTTYGQDATGTQSSLIPKTFHKKV